MISVQHYIETNLKAKLTMPLFKKSKTSSPKAAQLGSTPSEVTLVGASTTVDSAKLPTYTKSKRPKQALLSSQKDKFDTWEARLSKSRSESQQN